jgi:glycosyltransferase involved in cell wall biosynthesis
MSAVTSVTAFFPCYNDERTIGRLVNDVHGALTKCVADVEVVVVNDGSADGSEALLDKLAAKHDWLRVIHHPHNLGYGQALRSGFAAATKEWIFYTDGDGQYDAREVSVLLPLATRDVDIVQGHKIGRGDAWYRKVIGRMYHHTVRVMFGLPIRDTDCDFRLFRRSLLDAASLTATSGVICVEMMHAFHTAGARFVEVPVHHYPRPYGSSQFFKLPAVARSLRQLVQLWWRVKLRPRIGRR